MEIPPYFHITDMGVKTKMFIDCGGKMNYESCVSFQIWTANDYDHRLTPEKVIGIIGKGGNIVPNMLNMEVKVEYQTYSLSEYTLEPKGNGVYNLVPTKSRCLSPELCGLIEERKPQIKTCGRGDECCRNTGKDCDNPRCSRQNNSPNCC